MRKSKYSESQIAAILQEAEAGLAVAEVARKHGISAATFYQGQRGRRKLCRLNYPRPLLLVDLITSVPFHMGVGK